MSPERIAVQDLYPEDVAHCYGCGRLNEEGHRIQSYPEGEQIVARFTPRLHHTAIPGYVYGGLIASLIDCHGTGSAAIAAMGVGGEQGEGAAEARVDFERVRTALAAGRQAPRFVTATLEVSYLKPTPLGPELMIRGEVEEVKMDRDPSKGARKVTTRITVEADGVVTAEGRVTAARMPGSLIGDGT